MFEDFDKTSRETWEAKVVADLKGKPLDSLFWQVEQQLHTAPFYHPDDFETSPSPLVHGQASNDWLIGETFTAKDLKDTNKKMLKALNGGVNALGIRFEKAPAPEAFETLFSEINMEFISTNFILNPEVSLKETLENWLAFVSSAAGSVEKLKGSFEKPGISNDKELLSSIDLCSQKLPGFQLLGIRPDQGIAPSDSLADAISQSYTLLSGLSEAGIPLTTIARQIHFKLEIGKSFFVEIARLRALKLLWANLLKSFGMETSMPAVIHAGFDRSAMSPDANQQMIASATMALSAVVGGAKNLTVTPADHDNEDFSRRIARNVQHLLKMESFIDKVEDPAAGSYYIENLTRALGKIAWEKVQSTI